MRELGGGGVTAGSRVDRKESRWTGGRKVSRGGRRLGVYAELRRVGVYYGR